MFHFFLDRQQPKHYNGDKKRNDALRYEQAQLVYLLQCRMIDLGVNLLISIGT